MAAGLGFKTFATGDVLTAGDTNGYLMQGVWVFANAAARTAAVASPQEGNMSFLKDTNSTEYYDGSSWSPIGAAASGPAFFAYRTSNQSLTANVVTQVQFNAELFDTDNYFSSNAFTPLKAGYYQLNATLGFYSTTSGAEFQVRIYKNGAAYCQGTDTDLVGGFGGGSAGTLMYFNGTTDYATVYAYVNSGTCNIQGSQDQCQFSGVWIRS